MHQLQHICILKNWADLLCQILSELINNDVNDVGLDTPILNVVGRDLD